MAQARKTLRQLVNNTKALLNYDALKIKCEKLEKQNNQLTQEIKKVEKRQTSFEGKKITLKDLETHVQKTYHDEIQREADKKFSGEKEQLTLNLLNRLLKRSPEEMGEALETRLSTDIQNGVNTILQNREQWPQWFKQSVEENIEKEVTKRLNDIYRENVREGVENAKKQEWRPYLETYFQDTVTPFCNAVLLSRFLSECINRNVTMPPCKNCKQQWTIPLTQRDITNLLQNGTTTYSCSTPECIEGVLNRHPTHIHLSLGEVISMIVGTPTLPSKNAYALVIGEVVDSTSQKTNLKEGRYV